MVNYRRGRQKCRDQSQKEAADPGGQQGAGVDAVTTGRVGSSVQGHEQNSTVVRCLTPQDVQNFKFPSCKHYS